MLRKFFANGTLRPAKSLRFGWLTLIFLHLAWMSFGQSGVRTVYDVANRSLILQNKTNINGDGTRNGDVVRFNNVVTVDGQVIDAVVTTSLSNATLNFFDSDVSPSNYTDFFQPGIQSNTSGTAVVSFNFQFFLGGTYIRAGTGTPVTLQNLVINAYDIDGAGNGSLREFQEFRGFTTYQTSKASNGSSNTTLTAVAQTDGSVRFTSNQELNSSSDPRHVFLDRWRVRTTYPSASSILLKMGIISGNGVSRLFAVDMSLDTAWQVLPPLSFPTLAPIVSYSTLVFQEAAANNGSIGNTALLTLSNKEFPNNVANNSALPGVTFTNVPAGLSAQLIKNSATTATLSFTGNATNNQDANDVFNVGIAMSNNTFSGGNAAGVTNSTRQDLVIDFRNNPSKLAIHTQPSSVAQNDVAFGQQPKIALQDASGAVVAQAGVVITASIASGGVVMLPNL